MNEDSSTHTSPRPWHVVDSHYENASSVILDGEGTLVCKDLTAANAVLISDAVNLKSRIDEAMADEGGYLHPVVLDGKPMVCVTPPPSEAEEFRMHREYETSLLMDRERFRRGYYEVSERNDYLRDLVRRLHQMCCEEDWVRTNEAGRALLREARDAIEKQEKW